MACHAREGPGGGGRSTWPAQCARVECRSCRSCFYGLECCPPGPHHKPLPPPPAPLATARPPHPNPPRPPLPPLPGPKVHLIDMADLKSKTLDVWEQAASYLRRRRRVGGGGAAAAGGGDGGGGEGAGGGGEGAAAGQGREGGEVVKYAQATLQARGVPRAAWPVPGWSWAGVSHHHHCMHNTPPLATAGRRMVVRWWAARALPSPPAHVLPCLLESAHARLRCLLPAACCWWAAGAVACT